jgi:hypothetical protein
MLQGSPLASVAQHCRKTVGATPLGAEGMSALHADTDLGKQVSTLVRRLLQSEMLLVTQ